MSRDNRLKFLELVAGYGKSKVLEVAASLRVADHLIDAGKSASALAQLTNTNPSALLRLLRALAAMGILEDDDGVFTLTSLGRECLWADSDQSLEALARYLGHPATWSTWAALLHSVQTGQPAFQHIFGTTAWEYRAEHPELNRVFNAAMRAVSSGQKDAITEHYDFTGLRTVVDVGGGNGAVLAAIVAAYPHMRGVLFDQPHVVAGATELLKEAGVAERCEIIGGDFFVDIPSSGDLYVMRAVIHNWDDDQAKVILAGCRRAMVAQSKLLLVEGLLQPPDKANGAFWPSFLDMHMLVTLGGRQRTVEEFATLFASTGFEMTKVINMPGNYDLIEGRPV